MRPNWPAIPDDITGRELDRDVRASLGGLGTHGADFVAKHLVMTAMLIDDDPEAAWQHSLAARSRGARIPAVREAAGLAAYRAGHFAQALSELRTWRRLTGSRLHSPVEADAERGLGRPERALDIVAEVDAASLPHDQQIELLIVASGARTDLGQHDAAVLGLRVPALDSRTNDEATQRLRGAYVNALRAAGRLPEALDAARVYHVSLDEDGAAVDGIIEDADDHIWLWEDEAATPPSRTETYRRPVD